MNFRNSFSLTSLFVAIFVFGTATLIARAQSATEKPYTVEYYYKAKWGFQTEFIQLFKKNHYPVLKKEMELGRIIQVTATTPVYHFTEDGRWDYRVTIVWKSSTVAHDDFDPETITKQLYQDQETFKKEEQRRFEILLAHWDLPVESLDLEKK